MALRAKEPAAVEKRFKGLFFGDAGVGKTTAAIQFPKPYLIDTERGAENDEYVEHLANRGGVIFQTSDFEEVYNEVKALMSEEHEFRTLIIDPITTIYDDLASRYEDELGNDYGKHLAAAKRDWKRLSNLISRLDMNVIITSHGKKVWGEDNKAAGNTFDGPKGMDYLFDFVFEIGLRGDTRVASVVKTRMGKPGQFPKEDIFPFSYDEVAARYGRDVLEAKSVAVVLATDEQVLSIKSLLPDSGVSSEAVAKWLDKRQASGFEEVSSDDADKFITYLNGQIAAKRTGVA